MEPRTRTSLSRAIVRDIVETSVYRRSDTIMAYASFGSELQTRGDVAGFAGVRWTDRSREERAQEGVFDGG